MKKKIMASQKYVFSVMHVRRSKRGSLLRVVQCALAFRCKATDICAREPLLDAVETSALYGAGCRRRRRRRALSRRAAIPPVRRTWRIADTGRCRSLCGMRAPLARGWLPSSSCCCTSKTSKMLWGMFRLWVEQDWKNKMHVKGLKNKKFLVTAFAQCSSCISTLLVRNTAKSH